MSVPLISSCASFSPLYSPPSQATPEALKTFDNPGGYVDEGLIQYQINNYEVAAAYFNKASELDSQYQPAYAWLGVTYIYLGRREQAIQALERAIAINPNTEDANTARVWIQRLRQPLVVAVGGFTSAGGYRFTISRNVSDILLGKLFESGLYKTVSFSGFGGWQRSNANDMCRAAAGKEADILIIGVIENLRASVTPYIRTRYTKYKPLFKKGVAEARFIIQVYSARSCELLRTFADSAYSDTLRSGSIPDSEVSNEVVMEALNAIFNKFIKELNQTVL